MATLVANLPGLLLLLLLLLLLNRPSSGTALGFPSGESWDWISSIAELEGSKFKDVAEPLVLISANTYRYPRTRAIEGWSPSSTVEPVAPETGGLHALVYEEEASTRAVLAFRGTQISASLDSLADQCADMLLWDNYDYPSLPSNCSSSFNESTLDYFTQALAYTLLVLDSYPPHSLLLSGHSLGAGLAILVSAALSDTYPLPVIGFASPGTRQALADRSLTLQGIKRSIVTIAHQWDQVMRSNWEGQVGLLCLYAKEESSSCKSCLSASFLIEDSVAHGDGLALASMEANAIILPQGASMKANAIIMPQGDCWDCFLETHVLRSLIKVVEEAERPTCQEKPASNLSHA